jgi:arginine decarboxylase
MLVMDILGVGEFDVGKAPEKLAKEANRTVRNLFGTYKDISRKNLLESYHDALEYKEEALQLFNLGNLSLSERVVAEDIFWAICQRILKTLRELREVPEELEGLERALSDTYFCNFSMFQSLPDIWAIDQLFPIMPIHRLGEEPTRRAVLADITCDSDGKIDHFIDRRDVKSVLELHPVNGQDYYLGVFLIGAYQEILGDLHNLFGDTNAVHITLSDEGEVVLENIVKGDSVREVLSYVHFNADELMHRLQLNVETAVRQGNLDHKEAGRLMRFYEDALRGYTYLEEPEA